jgi:hypothetical protein
VTNRIFPSELGLALLRRATHSGFGQHFSECNSVAYIFAPAFVCFSTIRSSPRKPVKVVRSAANDTTLVYRNQRVFFVSGKGPWAFPQATSALVMRG